MNHASMCLIALLLASCNTKTAPPPPAQSAQAPATSGGGLGLSTTPAAPGAAQAHSDRAKPAVASLRESVEYDDGPARRKLWLSEDLVAEFDPGDAGRDAILLADPGAREVEQPQKSVRIWRLAGALRGDAFARQTGQPSLKLSPVLHEGPSPGLPMRALPGGVVATFQAGWDRARIDAWLEARGLHVEGEPVVAEANMYLVATPPGLDSMRIARELHDTGELADVVPNLWRQNAAR